MSPSRPGGIPLRFRVVEESLNVAGVVRTSDRELYGAVLQSVEGIPATELLARQASLAGHENEYHVLDDLGRETLWYRPYLQELIPEWQDTESIELTVRLPDGETSVLAYDLPIVARRNLLPSTSVNRPSVGSAGFGAFFLDPRGTGEDIAYFRADHLTRYREDSEVCIAVGCYTMTDAELHAIPSATEELRDMFIEMKERGTDTLITDLRDNGGGDSLMSDILIYFLVGADGLAETMTAGISGGGGIIQRFSELCFQSRSNLTLEGINEGRAIPLEVGDYDFSTYYGHDPDRFAQLAADPEAILYPFQAVYQNAPTFYEELRAGTYGGYHVPEHLIVLVNTRTFSSALTMTRDLYRVGATLIGTPSGQSSNMFGNAIHWELDNTGIAGIVSFSYYVAFPDDPDLGRVIPMHVPLTYAYLASTGFDPNAEILLALGSIESGT